MAERLKEGTDFYFDSNGLMVLTEAYLRRRGYCCGNGCRHCPYTEKPVTNRPSQAAVSQEDKEA